jgi:hypothetical protein
MRSMLPKTQDTADCSIRAIISWLNVLCSEDPDYIDQKYTEARDHLSNAEFVMRALDEYRSDLHECDIAVAQLEIQCNKFDKIKKIVNS